MASVAHAQELGDQAVFDPKKPRFFYTGPHARIGNYYLDWKDAEKGGGIFYRADHPLAVRVIQTALGRNLSVANLVMDYEAHGAKIAALEPLRGQKGWLEVSKLTVESFETEEFLVLAAHTDGGQSLDRELCGKLMGLPAQCCGRADTGVRFFVVDSPSGSPGGRPFAVG